MTTRRLPPATALLAAAALVGAGCGGGGDSGQPSADDAQSAYQSIRTQISGLGGSIGQAIGAASGENDAQLSEAFAQLQDRTQAAVARLRGLQVPDDLQDERDALRDALDSGGDDLAAIASAARASDADAARAAVQQLIADSQTIRDARADFERALDDATK